MVSPTSTNPLIYFDDNQIRFGIDIYEDGEPFDGKPITLRRNETESTIYVDVKLTQSGKTPYSKQGKTRTATFRKGIDVCEVDLGRVFDSNLTEPNELKLTLLDPTAPFEVDSKKLTVRIHPVPNTNSGINTMAKRNQPTQQDFTIEEGLYLQQLEGKVGSLSGDIAAIKQALGIGGTGTVTSTATVTMPTPTILPITVMPTVPPQQSQTVTATVINGTPTVTVIPIPTPTVPPQQSQTVTATVINGTPTVTVIPVPRMPTVPAQPSQTVTATIINGTPTVTTAPIGMPTPTIAPPLTATIINGTPTLTVPPTPVPLTTTATIINGTPTVTLAPIGYHHPTHSIPSGMTLVPVGQHCPPKTPTHSIPVMTPTMSHSMPLCPSQTMTMVPTQHMSQTMMAYATQTMVPTVIPSQTMMHQASMVPIPTVMPTVTQTMVPPVAVNTQILTNTVTYFCPGQQPTPTLPPPPPTSTQVQYTQTCTVVMGMNGQPSATMTIIPIGTNPTMPTMTMPTMTMPTMTMPTGTGSPTATVTFTNGTYTITFPTGTGTNPTMSPTGTQTLTQTLTNTFTNVTPTPTVTPPVESDWQALMPMNGWRNTLDVDPSSQYLPIQFKCTERSIYLMGHLTGMGSTTPNSLLINSNMSNVLFMLPATCPIDVPIQVLQARGYSSSGQKTDVELIVKRNADGSASVAVAEEGLDPTKDYSFDSIEIVRRALLTTNSMTGSPTTVTPVAAMAMGFAR